MEIPLLEGAYNARGVIAAAQRCVNLYPEVNQREAFLALPQPVTPSLTTHYPTPGLRPLVQGPIAEVRGLYRSTRNKLYAVIGNQAFYVTPSWTLQALGRLSTSKGQVRMQDNGRVVVIVDGTRGGYTIDLGTNGFSSVSDAGWQGSTLVTYLASYLFFNVPGTQEFYSTLSNQFTPIDPTYVAYKTSYPDLLQGIAALDRQLMLFGEFSVELWYLNGGKNFPVAEVPQGLVQIGTPAPYSIAIAHDAVVWLGQTLAGERIVYAMRGGQPQRISTHAIEYEFSKYPVVEDAIAFSYQQQGHTFYQLTFPSADKTWVWDVQAPNLWHERASLDGAGNEHRHRANCGAYAYGLNVVGDYANGWLYAYDTETYTDAGAPIRRIRGFPHLLQEGHRMFYSRFVANMECGQAPEGTSDLDVWLRTSQTRGASWNDFVPQGLGPPGALLTQPQWTRLGMARDMVFELSWTAPFMTALNGAFVDALPGYS